MASKMGEQTPVLLATASSVVQSEVKCCTALHCTALHCTALHCTAKYNDRRKKIIPNTSLN